MKFVSVRDSRNQTAAIRKALESEHEIVVTSNGELVTPVPLAVALPHPRDLPFLEVANQAGAVLVTGNLRHFPAKARAGVTVVGPRQFLDLLAQSL